MVKKNWLANVTPEELQRLKKNIASERFEMRLDSELKRAAEEIADDKDISLAELIRRYLRRLVSAKAGSSEE